MNRRGTDLGTPEATPLAAPEVRARAAAGALLLDLRGHGPFTEGHIPRSVSVPVDARGFGTRLAWLARPEVEIVLVGSEGEVERAAWLAAAVGLSDDLFCFVGPAVRIRRSGGPRS
jgi:hydroxyacylglutathione hydrolase